jgi:putative aldouronate transport system permease protein
MNKTHRMYLIKKIKKDKPFYIMFLPVIIFLIIFNYLPMVGLVNSLYEFTQFKREFIGLANFQDLFFGVRSTGFWRAFVNTITISLTNLVLGTILSVIIALLLNELIILRFKKFTQTVLYLPHFLSWIVAASIFTIIFSPVNGLVNNIGGVFGQEPIYYLAEEKWWQPIFYLLYRWKETGWGTIIYLAALSGINPELYEAAIIDGANRWQQTLHITIPSLTTTILIVFILHLGRVMYIFESVFALQNPNVFAVSDVLQTFAFRIGIENSEYGMGTAISFCASIIGLVFVLITNKINKKFRGSSLL